MWLCDQAVLRRRCCVLGCVVACLAGFTVCWWRAVAVLRHLVLIPTRCFASLPPEMPLASIQHLANTGMVQACGLCHRFVGTLVSQMAHLAGSSTSQAPWDALSLPAVDDSVAVLSEVEPCPGGCGTLYCSRECMVTAATAHHAMLCPGPAVEGAPLGSSAWRVFEMQAASTNDILVVGARVFAHIVGTWEANGGDLAAAMMPYTVFHARPWWEVRGQPAWVRGQRWRPCRA